MLRFWKVKAMVDYANECVDCGLPCIGSACPYRNVKRLYCDDCKDEYDELYEFDGEELCIDCIKKAIDEN